MIVKKIKSCDPNRPQAWQIGDLVDYIRSPHNKNPSEKIAHAGSRNMLSATHAGQKVEMIALAQESAHSNMPVTHWIFSWQANEQPTRDHVEDLVDIFLERMGLQLHQVIYGLHHDTDNFHLHLAVNRMNPKSGKVVQPNKGFDIREAHKILALVEKKQGWASEANALYTVLENGELVRRRTEKEVKPKQAALDFENATGEKSAQRMAQERGHSIMKEAKTWTELHAKLGAVGLRFVKKGSGAIVFVGDIAVKASSVDRAFSMKKLCARLGDFKDGIYPDMVENIAPEPVSTVNREEWETYQAECAAEKTELPYTRNTVRDTENAQIQALKIRQKQERVSKLSRLATHALPILNIARHCLKIQHQQEMRDMRRCLRKSRRKGGRPRFETWLRSHGMDVQADRWRHRKSLEEHRHTPAPLQEESMPRGSQELRQFQRYAIAVNADRFRVTCIRMEEDGQKKTFILDKKNGASKGFSHNELTARMPEMLRLQERGENIYYTPLSHEKHHILIDDMSQESLGRLRRDGFRPAVILESSPGNFQALLTIPKLQTAFDRDVGNRITERLNREYGDKRLCGCIHPHRAPGFENRKPKHRKENGTYPHVKLLFTERRQCARALELSRQIDREYAEAARKRQAIRQASSSSLRPGDPASAYYAHLENIRRHLVIEDHSRVDAMIALRMRANGHSQEAVAETIRICAPTIREGKSRRNWQRYAERTADYAFGMAGDRDLERNARYQELWRRIEGLEEREREAERVRMR